jgi:hypothetical protein
LEAEEGPDVERGKSGTAEINDVERRRSRTASNRVEEDGWWLGVNLRTYHAASILSGFAAGPAPCQAQQDHGR